MYLDNIVIFSQTEEEHQMYLEQVLECLERNKLFAKPSKCVIGAKEIEFYGHVVGSGQV